MGNESIFHRLIRNENSYTQILRNIMIRDHTFRKDVLSLFLASELATGVNPAHIFIQKRLTNGGQPDLLIETPSLSAIVEIKTENHRGRTAKQSLKSNADDDPKNYLQYLQSRRALGANALLIFLVPPGWKHWGDLEGEINAIAVDGKLHGVEVKQFTWTELLSRLSDRRTSEESPFASEFRVMIADRFGALRFDKEEVDSMERNAMSVASAMKVNNLIDQIRKAAGDLATPLQIAEGEFGFYLRKQKQWLLYFGCWVTFWEEHPAILCFGMDDATTDVKEAFRRSFREVYDLEAVMLNDKWIMGWVPNSELEQADPARSIWAKLDRIWSAVSNAAD